MTPPFIITAGRLRDYAREAAFASIQCLREIEHLQKLGACSTQGRDEDGSYALQLLQDARCRIDQTIGKLQPAEVKSDAA